MITEELKPIIIVQLLFVISILYITNFFYMLLGTEVEAIIGIGYWL